jgi:hypothetical protein
MRNRSIPVIFGSPLVYVSTRLEELYYPASLLLLLWKSMEEYDLPSDDNFLSVNVKCVRLGLLDFNTA